MLFNSLTFVLLHFVVLTLYWLSPRQGLRIVFLGLGSLVFYGWLYWPGIFFLLGVIAVNYFMGLQIEKTASPKWLAIAVSLNLLNLCYFKYVEFLARNLAALLELAHIDLAIPTPDYWLPLGISFITFQKIAYLVDIYKGQIRAEKNFLRFTCFAAFYGQLIAGPIVRSHEFLPQLQTKREFNVHSLKLGFFYFIMGVMMKVTVADTLAQFVEYGFGHVGTLSTNMAWLTLYAFATQILCDFWGYSTIALGCAYMLGIHLPINFNLPYSSASLTEFWRRWHITLSSWLRDYLYIPLGGNRTGGTYRNLIATMTLGGLWHGASWNFVLWGLLNGVWLAVERGFIKRGIVPPAGWWMHFFKVVLVFHGVCLLWVLFRAPSFDSALLYYRHLLLPPYSLSSVPSTLLTLLVLFLLFQNRIGSQLIDDRFLRLSLPKQLAMTLVGLMLILAYSQARLDFIYFVF